jgi:hypothetical protein
MKHLKKAQFGALIKAGAKAAAKKVTKEAPKMANRVHKPRNAFEEDLKAAITQVERNALKKRFQDIDKGLDKTSPPSEKISKAVKPKMQAGGVVKTTKRVGPVDPDGAWTKVQERNLPPVNAKTKVSLAPDKELGATKMMKKGGEVEKAKGGKWIQKAIKKPGALRAQLGAKKGEPIPAGKLAAAAKKPGKLGQRARLAQTLKKMKK